MEDAMKTLILVVLALGACSTAEIEEQSGDRIVVMGHGPTKGSLVEAQARQACATQGKRPMLILDEFVWWEYAARRYVYDCVD